MAVNLKTNVHTIYLIRYEKKVCNQISSTISFFLKFNCYLFIELFCFMFALVKNVSKNSWLFPNWHYVFNNCKIFSKSLSLFHFAHKFYYFSIFLQFSLLYNILSNFRSFNFSPSGEKAHTHTHIQSNKCVIQQKTNIWTSEIKSGIFFRYIFSKRNLKLLTNFN